MIDLVWCQGREIREHFNFHIVVGGSKSWITVVSTPVFFLGSFTISLLNCSIKRVSEEELVWNGSKLSRRTAKRYLESIIAFVLVIFNTNLVKTSQKTDRTALIFSVAVVKVVVHD